MSGPHGRTIVTNGASPPRWPAFVKAHSARARILPPTVPSKQAVLVPPTSRPMIVRVAIPPVSPDSYPHQQQATLRRRHQIYKNAPLLRQPASVEGYGLHRSEEHTSE